MPLFKKKKCEECGKEVISLRELQGKKVCLNCNLQARQETRELTKKPKQITETKCVCQACDNMWFYGKTDKLEQFSNASSNCGKSMMCCGGCLPAVFIPDKKTTDLNKCPKCGSRAIKKETITHNV
jgi:DNA-directed RNA polymerase subunit RPC12/RpoP